MAYNLFYRNRWDRLSVDLNWKPYWGLNPNAELIHFHGPKVFELEAITDQRWDWDSDYGKQIGSLFGANRDSYLYYLNEILSLCPNLNVDELDKIKEICGKIEKFDPKTIVEKIDVQFMDFKMFPE